MARNNFRLISSIRIGYVKYLLKFGENSFQHSHLGTEATIHLILYILHGSLTVLSQKTRFACKNACSVQYKNIIFSLRYMWWRKVPYSDVHNYLAPVNRCMFAFILWIVLLALIRKMMFTEEDYEKCFRSKLHANKFLNDACFLTRETLERTFEEMYFCIIFSMCLEITE